MQKRSFFQISLIVTLTFLVTILAFFGLVWLFFYSNDVPENFNSRAFIVIAYVSSSIIFFGFTTIHLIHWCSLRFGVSFNPRRISVQTSLLLLLAFVLSSLFYFVIRPIGMNELDSPIPPLFRLFTMNSFIAIIMSLAFEVWLNINRNEILRHSIARLEKEQLKLKLSSLQQKLNPHFLFNSLNVLSELVHEDADKADQFIHQFSKVYRYVLELEKENLVSVYKELEFLESYLYLLKIRFGESLNVSIKIDETLKDKRIPVLSLQLLIENAIKHNKITPNDPLSIHIYNDHQFLTVRNSLNIKEIVTDSYGMGLNRIKESYELIGEREMRVEKDENDFIVKLPVLEKL